jgi:hypothetical protein
MGCLRLIGCLTVLAIGVAVGYVTRPIWRAKPASGWEPLTPHGAAVAKRAVESLEAPKGPAYVEVTGAEFAAYALKGAVPESAQAAVIDDRLHVRTRADVPRMGREDVEIVGTIDVPRPGVGEWRATEIKVGDVPLPPALLSRIFHGADSATVGLPAAVGDIRVARGHITLYKKTP